MDLVGTLEVLVRVVEIDSFLPSPRMRADPRWLVHREAEDRILTRKLMALRQEVWRLMHAPQATQHE
jgi:hypothetical protein